MRDPQQSTEPSLSGGGFAFEPNAHAVDAAVFALMHRGARTLLAAGGDDEASCSAAGDPSGDASGDVLTGALRGRLMVAGDSLLPAVRRVAFDEHVLGLVEAGLADLTGEQDGPTALQRQLATESMRLQAQRQSLSEAMRRSGVDPLYFKGVLADAQWWQGSGVRGCSDIDLLIEPGSLEVVDGILRDFGLEPLIPTERAATLSASKERPYQPVDGAMRRSNAFGVDVHLGLLNDPPFRDPSLEVQRRARIYRTPFGAILGPCPEDQLAFLAGNLGGDAFGSRLRLSLDAWCTIALDGCDVGLAAERAQAWGCGWSLWALLLLVHTRFGLATDDAVMKALAPPAILQSRIRAVAGVDGPPPKVGRPLATMFHQHWLLSQRWWYPGWAVPRAMGLRWQDRFMR